MSVSDTILNDSRMLGVWNNEVAQKSFGWRNNHGKEIAVSVNIGLIVLQLTCKPPNGTAAGNIIFVAGAFIERHVGQL